MTLERWLEVEDGDSPLTAEERAEGWHWCYDWDGLLIGPGMQEMESCTCKPRANERSE